MDAINAITQKSERSTIAGSSDEFKTVADGFAALLQLTGNKGTVDSALSAAESEFLRVDDSRDLVRDSHTLNNADSHNDDADDSNNVDEPDADDDTRSADDNNDTEDTEQDASESSDDTTAEDGAAEGENQDAAAGSGENQNKPQVAGDGVAANLNVVEGAAAAAAATAAQVKTTSDAVTTQAAGTQNVQAVSATDGNAAQNSGQNQQAGTEAAQKLTGVQTDLVDRSLTPTENQAAQTAAAAAQTQVAKAQQNTTQSAQAQAQQAPQVNQERTQGQSAEVRSAAAQTQSQDLSQRLGDDARARVQVNVTGQQAAQTSTEPGQFNRFVGYNPGDSRTISTANGQAGSANVTNAAVATTDTPAEKPAAQTTAPIPTSATQPHTQASQPGAPATLAARAELAAASSRGESTQSQSGNGQSNASTNTTTTTAPQPAAQATATQSGQTFAQTVQQTAAADRPPAPTSTQVIEQIKVNINKTVKAGMDRVTIQLRPENLGRIEVKMELSQDGKVRALVTADTRETLDLLQRDARGLERALQDAGLRTDSNNLHFELRSEQQAQQGHSKDGTAANDNAGEEELSEEYLEEQEYDRAQAAAERGGVDQTV